MLRIKHPPRTYLLLAALAAFSFGGYLLAAALVFRLGFPLDDAWIHQTYARNLATRGEWAFIPGQPSAGSTAPLWSLALIAGFLLGLPPLVWTSLLGWLSLWLLGLMCVWSFRTLCPSRGRAALWAGVLLVLEWHLVWAVGSGMETALFALVVLAALTWMSAGAENWFAMGILIGLSIWVRPDGVTLLGPALMVIYFNRSGWKDRLWAATRMAIGVLLLAGPYLLFNYTFAGAIWPNTFFAKQAEYAVHRQLPLWRRMLAQAGLPLVGVGATLLPGFILFILHALRRRMWGVLAGALWVLGYLFLFALRLPVTYQHGRYVIPAMPVFFIWSFAGVMTWVRPGSLVAWRRVLSRTWLLAIALVAVLFWFLGARAFALDVAIIESEMVETAHWVSKNTSEGALVAAHDIGALGFFGERQLLDLAGLVSPEVIPFIRDEARLAAYLDARGANYLVTFPEWYPELTRDARLLYATRAPFAPALGGENMAVYLWFHP